MGAAIGQVLPTAVGVALSPLPIVAVVLMLVSARGRANGPAFVVGWLIGLALVGAIVLSIASAVGATDHGKPAAWVSALKLALGVLLLLLGLRQWQGRRQEGDEVPTPKWMGALETFTPVKAFGAGGLLSGVNPKNLFLVIAGASTIAQTTELPRASRPLSTQSLWSSRRSEWAHPSSSTSPSAVAHVSCWTV